MNEPQLTSTDSLQVVHALVVTLAVVLTPLVAELRRRSRLSRAKYLVELLDTKEALVQRLGGLSSTPESNAYGTKILKDLNSEFAKLATRKVGRYYFYVAAAGEVFLFALLIFGFNAGSGVHFLEGVWEMPALRFGLTLIIVSLSVLASTAIAWSFEKSYRRLPGGEATLFLVFNGIFVALSLAISMLLLLVDPYTDAF